MASIVDGKTILETVPFMDTMPASATYSLSTGIDLSAADFVIPVGTFCRGLLIQGTGLLDIQWENGNDMTLIPIVVPASGHFQFRGFLIRKIYMTSTCFAVAATSGIRILR